MEELFDLKNFYCWVFLGFTPCFRSHIRLESNWVPTFHIIITSWLALICYCFKNIFHSHKNLVNLENLHSLIPWDHETPSDSIETWRYFNRKEFSAKQMRFGNHFAQQIGWSFRSFRKFSQSCRNSPLIHINPYEWVWFQYNSNIISPWLIGKTHQK